MIKRKFRPGILSLVALIVGVLLLAFAAYGLLTWAYGADESRRTISRFFALFPALAIGGVLGIALSVSVAFRPTCTLCRGRLEQLDDLVYPPQAALPVIAAARASDWQTLRDAPRVTQPYNREVTTPGCVVVQRSVCVACGEAGQLSAYRSGTGRASAEPLIRRQDAPGAELVGLTPGAAADQAR